MQSLSNMEVISTQNIMGRQFNIYGDYENPLFLAKDIAEFIDYSKTGKGASDVSRMLNNIDNDEKLIRTIFVSGQTRKSWFLTEDGLYEVLMQSRKPIAKAFKKEVKAALKDIRKHGVYMTNERLKEALLTPETIISLALELKAERDRAERLEAENTEIRPRAEYADFVAEADGLFTATQIAAAYGMKAAELNRLLEKYGVQYRKGGRWILYSRYQRLGYTVKKEMKCEGRNKAYNKWTEKGRLFVFQTLKENGVLPLSA